MDSRKLYKMETGFPTEESLFLIKYKFQYACSSSFTSSISIRFFSMERHAIKMYTNTTGINSDTIDIAFNVKKLEEELKMVSELCRFGVAG